MTEEQRMIDEGARSFMALTGDWIDAIRARRFDEAHYSRRMARFNEWNLKLILSEDERQITLAAVNQSILTALREMAESGWWRRRSAEKRLYALATSWQRLVNEVMS